VRSKPLQVKRACAQKINTKTEKMFNSFGIFVFFAFQNNILPKNFDYICRLKCKNKTKREET